MNIDHKNEHYWPQHKVFFVATLVLFPEKLNGHEVNEWFYKPYFIGKGQDVIELELKEYQKAGYIEYEKPGVLFKITSVDTNKAAKDLTLYLKEWQQGNLYSLAANKPPDPDHQRQLLLDAIVQARANHQSNPRITLEDVYGKPDDYKYEPPFWELALSYHLVDHKAEIVAIGYDQRKSGLYNEDAEPFAEYKIVDKAQLNVINRKLARKKKPTAPPSIVQSKPEPEARDAEVFLRGRYVCVNVTGDNTYKIAALEKDGTLHRFMKFLTDDDNADIDVKIDEVKLIQGLASTTDLTELVRYCGFNRSLKKAFFPTMERDRIRFRQSTTLDSTQITALKEQASKQAAKNR